MNLTKLAKSAFITAMCLSLSVAHAQLALNWSKTYGGNGADRGHSIKQTADGGYIVSGYTDSNNNGDVTGHNGSADVWVVKLDASGNLTWQSAFGGSNAEPFTEAFTNVILTSDGGYLVTAESMSNDGDLTFNHGNLDLWVFKLDSQGNLLWQNSLGGSIHEGANAVFEEADGSFILAGYTSSADGDVSLNKGMTDGWIVKLSSLGTIIWEKTLGGTWTDAISAMKQTSDGGYIATGYTLSNDGDLTGLNPDGFAGYADYWTIKLDASANIVWQAVYGGTGKDYARAVCEVNNGEFIVAGESESADGDVTQNNGDKDWWVIKLSATGLLIWENSLGGSNREELSSISFNPTADEFLMIGTTESIDGNVTTNHGEKDIWMIQMNSVGNITVNKCYGGTGNEVGFDGIHTADDGIVIIGRTNSDSNGDILNDTQGEDLWVFKLGGSTSNISEIKNENDIVISPNPSNGVFNFSSTTDVKIQRVLLMDSKGAILIEQQNNEFNFIDLTPFENGIYFLQVDAGENNFVKQIIKN